MNSDDVQELADYDDVDDLHDEEDVATEDKQPVKLTDDLHSVHASGFRDFLLKQELQKAIMDAGFENPSQVQTECLPQALLGTDVLCQAKSGMGKTLVFVLSILHQLDTEPAPNTIYAMIITPARELAYQISHEFDRFKKYLPKIKTSVIYGGVQLDKQRAELAKEPPHIIVATPGRLLQLIQERHPKNRKDKLLDLRSLKFFVVDECDVIMDNLQMRKDLQSILKMTPHEKQVMMFSATMSPETSNTCKRFMHQPHEIIITDGSKLTLHGLKQYYVELTEEEKTRKLVELLDVLEFNQAVIFVASISRAEELNRILVGLNFPSVCTHGRLPQETRIERYRAFKSFRTRIMVVTKLFGRGIDIERVNVVINYDMPVDSNEYLHKVGRAGRFGTKGLAISFVSSEADAVILNSIQKVFTVSVPKLPATIESSTYM